MVCFVCLVLFCPGKKNHFVAVILEGMLPISFFWDHTQSLRNTIRKSNGKRRLGVISKMKGYVAKLVLLYMNGLPYDGYGKAGTSLWKRMRRCRVGWSNSRIVAWRHRRRPGRP